MLIDELRDVRYFVEVARCHSFSAAAVRLSVSSGAVSKAVARLEARMRAALFVRSSRMLRLTPEGERLFARVDGACHALETAWADHGEEEATVSGTVHLSTFSIYGRTHLTRLLPPFLSEHPAVNVVVSVHDNWRSTSRDRSDVRITFNEPLDEDKVAQPLGVQSFIMVAGPAYLAAHGTPRTVEDIAGHECIAGIGPSGSHIQWHFHRAADDRHWAVAPRGRVALMDEMSMAIDLARSNLGLTLCDPADVAADLAAGTLVRVLDDHAITTRSKDAPEIVLQFRPRHYSSPAANALVDHILRFHEIRPA